MRKGASTINSKINPRGTTINEIAGLNVENALFAYTSFVSTLITN
jgi:hypothetical protein